MAYGLRFRRIETHQECLARIHGTLGQPDDDELENALNLLERIRSERRRVDRVIARVRDAFESER